MSTLSALLEREERLIAELRNLGSQSDRAALSAELDAVRAEIGQGERAAAAEHAPKAMEIRAKQKAMDSETLANHPAWEQRTTAAEAARQLVLEESEAVKGENEHKSTIKLDRDRVPQPSQAEWASKYEVTNVEDGSVSYRRDGEERIRDYGRDLEVSNDHESIRDAIRLCKEQGVEKLDVRCSEPDKRAAIMQEAYRSGIQIETHQDTSIEAEYREAAKAVETERARDAKAMRDLQREHEQHAEVEAG